MRGAVWGLLVVAVGCGPRGGGSAVVVVPGDPPPAPAELPPVPDGIREPPAPAAEANGKDLSKLSARELKDLATQAAARRDFRAAAAAEYWAVRAGGGDRYDLACYSVRAKDVNAAYYWLTEAATKQGVDLFKHADNPDFIPVREDPKYIDHIFPFLAKCSQYFAAHGKPITTLDLPAYPDKSKPSAVIVTLHGRGVRPETFVNGSALADATGLPVVGVSGSVPLGPTRFAWAVDAVKDADRVNTALKTYPDKLPVSARKVIAVGFDEGGQVAMELAVREPDKYAGAIVISPSAEFKLDNVAHPPKTSRFVVVMGTRETWNREVVKKDCEFLAAAGVPLEYVEIPNGEHVPPTDLATRLPQWVKFVLDTK